MATRLEDVIALESLESRLRMILPERYQDSYEELMPVSMGSAGLKYDIDGNVAWDEIWSTFCDLAMAGGPPHRGTLLEPGSLAEIVDRPDEYDRIAAEISRGIRMVTGLTAQSSSDRGWIQVSCSSEGMAGWLVRAVVMENILARHHGKTLYLPAGPRFRLHKEIKNVITAIAKTCHYWAGHVPSEQQQLIEHSLQNLQGESRLLGPGLLPDIPRNGDSYARLVSSMAEKIHSQTGLLAFGHRYLGWIGVQCPDVRSAVWMMRAMVVDNILARREEGTLYLPVNPSDDPQGERVVQTLSRIHCLAGVKGVL